jgi:hypothetical protein
MIVVAQRLPEARFIVIDRAQASNPLGALPKVEVRHQQTGRAALLRLQGLTFIGIDYSGLPSRHLFQGQVGDIAPFGEGDHVTGGGSDLRE